MPARAHLKLIVSGPPTQEPDESGQDRLSMVQPLGSRRLRLYWLRAHAVVLVLWSASACLLCVAAWLLVRRF